MGTPGGGNGAAPDGLPDIDQEVVVTFRYPVKFTHGLLDPLNSTLRDVVEAENRARLLVVIDEGVADAHPTMTSDVVVYCAAHADVLELTAPPLVVPGGEAIKNRSGPVDEIRAAIDVHGVDRHSYVVAIGGGAVLDAVGYAAATAHRGVRLIRVPTTVLSQDDSAVGVKNGINAFGKKNFVGSFAPPHAVLNDFDLLTTLSDRDWRAGISEAVKVALLKDAAFFRWIEFHAGELEARSLRAM
jgi:3-dehydroquinate synthase